MHLTSLPIPTSHQLSSQLCYYSLLLNKITMSYQSSGVPQKWKQVVDKVQKANLNNIQKIRWNQAARKKAYCQQLDSQVSQHIDCQNQNRHRKIKQKAEAASLAERQIEAKSQQKMCKMKTEQKYQAENLGLINTKAKPSIQHYPENPFVDLVDKQQERHRATKMKFQLQNYLNSIQCQLKDLSKRKLLQLQKNLRKTYQNHVQEEFEQKIKNRESFKSKYLKVPSSNLGKINSKCRSRNQYLDYLSDQVQENKHRKNTERDQIDSRLQNINSRVDEPDSSPAYLGRNLFAHDRAKQYSYIDKALKIPQNLAQNPEKPRYSLQEIQVKRLEASPRRIKQNQLPQIGRQHQNRQKIIPYAQPERKPDDVKNIITRHQRNRTLPTPRPQRDRINTPAPKIFKIKNSPEDRIFSPPLKSVQNPDTAVGYRMGEKKAKSVQCSSMNIQELSQKFYSQKSVDKSSLGRSYFRYDFISGINRPHQM